MSFILWLCRNLITLSCAFLLTLSLKVSGIRDAGLNFVFKSYMGMNKKALRQQPHRATTVNVVNDFYFNFNLPSLPDDAINAVLGLTQGSLSYSLFNYFLRRSRQFFTDDLQCVRFINGLANFQLQTPAKSDR
jgi:hypothetical protein